MSDTMPDLARLYEAVLTGDATTAVEVVELALAAGADPKDLVTNHMIPAMDEVGSRFENGEYFIPELLISGNAMKGALELVRPLLADQGVEPDGRVVIGTVKGDLHDIGKGLVTSMLEGGGFEVFDLGVDVSAQDFIAKTKETGADILALSALLTTTMPAIKEVIDAMRAAGLLEKCKVIVGGAPLTQQYADSIGADGYSNNAIGAVNLARQLLTV